MRKFLMLAAAVALVGVVGVGGASPAGAVPRSELNHVTGAQSPSNSTPTREAFATCPLGEVVVGGGGQIFDGTGNSVRLTRLKPERINIAIVDEPELPPQPPIWLHRFSVGAEEPASGYSGNWSLQAYAICAPASEVPGHQIRAVPTQSNQIFLDRHPSCPTGTYGLSGGAEVTDTDRHVGLQSVGVTTYGSKATVHRDDIDFTDYYTFTTYTVCTTQAPVGHHVAAGYPPGDNGGVSCQAPNVNSVHGAGGGGHDHVNDGNTWLQALVPHETLDRVSAEMTSTPPNGLRVSALCGR